MSALNLHVMRMGPGKHLQGRTSMNGLVKPDYFHELVITQEFARCSCGVVSEAMVMVF